MVSAASGETTSANQQARRVLPPSVRSHRVFGVIAPQRADLPRHEHAQIYKGGCATMGSCQYECSLKDDKKTK